MIEPGSSEEEDEEFADSSDFGGRVGRVGGAANSVSHKSGGAGQGLNGTGPRLDVPNGNNVPR